METNGKFYDLWRHVKRQAFFEGKATSASGRKTEIDGRNGCNAATPTPLSVGAFNYRP